MGKQPFEGVTKVDRGMEALRRRRGRKDRDGERQYQTPEDLEEPIDGGI